MLLNKKLKDGTTLIKDKALETLCLPCNAVANELLATLNKLKAKSQRQKWESMRKALRSAQSREDIEQLEWRLAMIRDELNLRIVVDLRYALLSTCAW